MKTKTINDAQKANIEAVQKIYGNFVWLADFVVAGAKPVSADEAEELKNIDLKALRETLKDANQRALIKSMLANDGHDVARYYHAVKKALTMLANTHAGNKAVALVHSNGLATTGDDARKQLISYINYNYRKGLIDCPVPLSDLKKAVAQIEPVYSARGLNLDAMLRKAIKVCRK